MERNSSKQTQRPQNQNIDFNHLIENNNANVIENVENPINSAPTIHPVSESNLQESKSTVAFMIGDEILHCPSIVPSNHCMV